MARVFAVCKSEEKGTRKQDVGEGLLEEKHGLVGDAHADCSTHRQVSLLAIESIEKMRSLGFDVNPGDFAENITTDGIDLVSIPVGTCLSIGDEVLLEVTQIGKECHKGCAIYQQIGKCVMPKEGVFAKVIRGGLVRTGNRLGIREDGE